MKLPGTKRSWQLSSFLTWYQDGSEYHRALLLVDELPDLFEENEISIKTMNSPETELDERKPSGTRRSGAALQSRLPPTAPGSIPAIAENRTASPRHLKKHT